MSVAPEDIEMIAHIDYICGRVHDFGDDLYEGLMERDHAQVKKKAQELIQVLADLTKSLTEEL